MFRLALIVSLALAVQCATSSSTSCPGGYQNGDRFNSGRYWYECKDGQVIPKGCLSDRGDRVDVQSTYDTAEARMQCVLDSDGYLVILYKSCMSYGAERMVGDRWDDGKIWYTCEKAAKAVRATAIGCVYEGRPIAFGDNVARDKFVYTCKKATSGQPEMAVTGCAKNGNKYRIGETAQDSTLWYTCTDSGWQTIGCIHENAQLRDGDIFHEGDIAYKCTVNGDKTGPVAYACLMEENGVDTEKKFGCFWTEGDAPYQFEYTCKYDETNNKALKIQTRCSYKSNQGVFRVEPGCYAEGGGSLAVGCIKDYNSGLLRVKTFPIESIDTSYGLRKC